MNIQKAKPFKKLTFSINKTNNVRNGHFTDSHTRDKLAVISGRRMENVAGLTSLIEMGCNDENKTSFKKEKLKFLLIYVFSTVVIILLCLNTILLEEKGDGKHMQMSDCIHWKCENITFPLSSPKCAYIDKYPLSDEVYVRICRSEGNITLDIRRFDDEKDSGSGIQLNRMQWQYLKRSINHIDSSLLESTA